ncbi:MAG: Crp/Fnr family transcriptional regulator [Phreatobacter sp.]|nr:Crp/Fnr family transcriptional regulator [Phreatobacter sp.]
MEQRAIPAGPAAAWLDRIGTFAGLDAASRQEIARRARILHMAKDGHPFVPGAPCEAYLIVLEGCVRVQIVAESGREIVLYRVSAGESCVLTTSCLLKHEPYAAEALCESAVTAVAIPAPLFHDLLGSSPAFRNAVLESYATRVADLIMTFEELAFRRLDRRLAETLVERAADGAVTATHHDLAVELGSAREVVSRALKALEQDGMVALGRGVIRITAPEKLARLARAV